MGAPKSIAFLTIGQAPRSDLTPEIVARLGEPVRVEEFGVLDRLSRQEIAAMAPADGAASLCTRLVDGEEVVIDRDRTEDRLQNLVDAVSRRGFDAVVLLCTGHFPKLTASGLFLESQRIVDASLEAVSGDGTRVGVMVPLARQKDEIHLTGRKGGITAAHFSPYAGNRLAEAADELAGCDLVVMHCMGYTEAMREKVAARTGRPVLLARRMVAATVQQLL